MEQIEEAAAKAEEQIEREAATDPSIRKMTHIVEKFLRSHRVMCYGGTALNNLLPAEDQFYDKEKDIPDYDFFSETPQLHAMNLADMYYAAGYTNVEVKPGVHLRTFKVFVDYVGMADITFLHKPIFDKLWDEHYVREGIHYVSPDYLRMSVYLELSRPRGDVSRWVKVYKRLMLLNKHYPVGCDEKKQKKEVNEILSDSVREELEHFLQHSDVVLLGLHAVALHTPKRIRDAQWKLPIDLLVEPSHMKKNVAYLRRILPERVRVHEFDAYAELLPPHTDLMDEHGHPLIRLFETTACHSYHQLKDGMKIASIPTLLQFFFAFMYADAKELVDFDAVRILCVAQRLVDMAHHAGSRRFELLTPLDCIGYQSTLADIREEKSKLYESIPRSSPEFLRIFFTYNPVNVTFQQKKKLRQLTRKLTGEELVQKSRSKRVTRRNRRSA